jgi:hypothetical protein
MLPNRHPIERAVLIARANELQRMDQYDPQWLTAEQHDEWDRLEQLIAEERMAKTTTQRKTPPSSTTLSSTTRPIFGLIEHTRTDEAGRTIDYRVQWNAEGQIAVWTLAENTAYRISIPELYAAAVNATLRKAADEKAAR